MDHEVSLELQWKSESPRVLIANAVSGVVFLGYPFRNTVVGVGCWVIRSVGTEWGWAGFMEIGT